MTLRDQGDILMPRRLFEHFRGLVIVADQRPQLRPATCGDCKALVEWALGEGYRAPALAPLGEQLRHLEASP